MSQTLLSRGRPNFFNINGRTGLGRVGPVRYVGEVRNIIDLFLHLERHLLIYFQEYGTALYPILFAIIFCETGLVVTPFLPGDSLLFAVGAFSADGYLDIRFLYAGLFAAAVLGDIVNYSIGRYSADWVITRFEGRFLKRQHVNEAHLFFEKWGGWAIVLARFAPFLRTFVPFVAGAGKMSYPKFLAFNLLGGFLWISAFLLSGYYFGQLPFFKNNFKLLVLGIVAISTLPVIIGLLKMRLAKPENETV